MREWAPFDMGLIADKLFPSWPNYHRWVGNWVQRYESALRDAGLKPDWHNDNLEIRHLRYPHDAPEPVELPQCGYFSVGTPFKVILDQEALEERFPVDEHRQAWFDEWRESLGARDALFAEAANVVLTQKKALKKERKKRKKRKKQRKKKRAFFRSPPLPPEPHELLANAELRTVDELLDPFQTRPQWGIRSSYPIALDKDNHRLIINTWWGLSCSFIQAALHQFKAEQGQAVVIYYSVAYSIWSDNMGKVFVAPN